MLRRAYDLCCREVDQMIEDGVNPTDLLGMEETRLVIEIADYLGLPKRSETP